MPLARSIIARARPEIQSGIMAEILREEAGQGCDPALAAMPLELEPPFRPMEAFRIGQGAITERGTRPAAPPVPGDLRRYRVWISPEEEVEDDYIHVERFLKQLAHLRNRAGLEIQGNAESCHITLFCHDADSEMVKSAFRGAFVHHRMQPLESDPLDALPPGAWDGARLYDLWPPPYYSRLLTRVQELRYTALEPLLSNLAALPPPTTGLYQVLFQPVSPAHNWHHNVETLQDIEFAVKSAGSLATMQRFAQQRPSGDLRNMANELESKAHNDKPFFAVALRLAVLGEGLADDSALGALAACLSLFQHGGRPLNRLGNEDYRIAPGFPGFYPLLRMGLTYRHGFLLNSLELAGLCHLPRSAALEDRSIPLEQLRTLAATVLAPADGARLGFSRQGTEDVDVVVPDDIETLGMHNIGSSGTGKSTVMKHLVLQDVECDRAVVVVDPHGSLVKDLLRLIPEAHADRCIYFNPGMQGYVPLWNPLHRLPGQDVGRTASDMVAGLKGFTEGWGDRLDYLLQHTFSALIELPDATLYDAMDLLIPKSPMGLKLRKLIEETSEGAYIRRFWHEEFGGYTRDALKPPLHKLGKLFDEMSLQYMLSQPESRILIPQVIDEKRILLVDLSDIGIDTGNDIASLMVSLVRLAMVARKPNSVPEERVCVYCDESHRFLGNSMEHLFAEGRKYNVKFHMAHQWMRQFTQDRADALGSAGTAVCFRVDEPDAKRMAGRFLGKATPQDLMDLENYEAIARIGRDIVRLWTYPSAPETGMEVAERIVAQSKALYYKPVEEVREIIGQRRERLLEETGKRAHSRHQGQRRGETFVYDEF